MFWSCLFCTGAVAATHRQQPPIEVAQEVTTADRSIFSPRVRLSYEGSLVETKRHPETRLFQRPSPHSLTFIDLPRLDNFEARRQEAAERLCYSFSKLLSASLPQKLAALAAASLLLVLIGGSLLVLTGKTDSWKDALFQAYALLNNVPGINAIEGRSPLHILATNAVFVTGVLSFAVVLGAVTGSMQAGLEAAMRGTGRVVERGHILLLNADARTVPVVRMMDAACKDGLPPVPVVILTPHRKARPPPRPAPTLAVPRRAGTPPRCRACSWRLPAGGGGHPPLGRSPPAAAPPETRAGGFARPLPSCPSLRAPTPP